MREILDVQEPEWVTECLQLVEDAEFNEQYVGDDFDITADAHIDTMFSQQSESNDPWTFAMDIMWDDYNDSWELARKMAELESSV